MRYLTVICMMLASFSGAVSQTMTHEETMVRTSYARFAYAVQQGAIGKLALDAKSNRTAPEYSGMTSAERLANSRVTFTLSDFKIGNMRDIMDRRITDFITQPDKENLASSLTEMSYTEPGLSSRWSWFELTWQEAPAPPPPAGANMTFTEVYPLLGNKVPPDLAWQRYASYTVTVSFEGQSRGPYKALFIFGHDAKGNEVLEPHDLTTDSSGLVYSLHQALFPEPLLLGTLRTYPVVAKWLFENQMPDSACSPGRRDICCDLVKLKCGPGRTDEATLLSQPLPK